MRWTLRKLFFFAHVALVAVIFAGSPATAEETPKYGGYLHDPGGRAAEL
jgi:hypothetical protein